MDVEAFLVQFIDGYLLSDLHQMATLGAMPNGMGAAGYPIVGTTIAGMSLLGGLASEGYSGRSGWREFKLYWDGYLMPSNSAYLEPYADIIHELARHGIAHTSLASVGITVTKGSPGDHLKPHAHGFNVDATKFYTDFKESYSTYKLSALPGGVSHELISGNIRTFFESGEAAAARVLASLSTDGSGAGPQTRTTTSGIHSLITTDTTTMVERFRSNSFPSGNASLSAMPMSDVETIGCLNEAPASQSDPD